MLELRDYQRRATQYVRNLEERGRFRVCLESPTGCLSATTPVLMFDGSIKSAYLVTRGDVIMGPDSGPRYVAETHYGWGRMYRVSPTKGDSWVCSEHHILSLVKTAESKGDALAGRVIDVSVRDYLKWPKWKKHIFKQFAVGVDFKDSGDLPLDPYFFGIWLGDGSKGRRYLASGKSVLNNVGVSKPDPEIRLCCEEIAKKFGLHVSTSYGSTGCPTYHLVGGRHDINPLKDLLSRLYGGGIDKQFLVASRIDRLSLLAGLLDTDGYLGTNCFEFSQKDTNVFRDVVFLARSLGFRVSTRTKTVRGGIYYVANISGDTSTIPTRIPRKKATTRLQKKNPLRTGLSVGYEGIGVYYGFRITGDGRHLLGDFTVTHNSGKTIIAADLLRDARRQYVITHRCILLDQLMKVLTENGIPYGVVASGHKPTPKAPVQLCMWQTLLRRPDDFLMSAERLHIDEIHCMGGEKCLGLFEGFVKNGASVIGYTATPSNISKSVNSVYCVATVRELIDQGHLCQPITFGCSQPDMRKLEALKRDAAGEFTPQSLGKLVSPQYIFGHVLEQYKRLSPDGGPFVLFAHSVKASIWWAQHLTAKGVPTAHIDGDDVWVDGKFVQSDSSARADVFARLESGELKGVSNRFVLREGWNAPFIGHAILTTPFGTRKTFVQACGRVLRPYEERSHCVIQDHSGSSITLPALDSSEPWDWDSPPGRAERIRISQLRNNPDAESIEEMSEGDEPREPIVCPKCTAERYSGSVCPYCGHHYTKRARFVHQTNGQLRLVEGRAYRPRKSRPAPNDAALWRRMFLAAKKNKPNRTPEQIYCFFAKQNNWRWLPRDLPNMPCEEAGWFQKVSDLRRSDLIPE